MHCGQAPAAGPSARRRDLHSHTPPTPAPASPPAAHFRRNRPAPPCPSTSRQAAISREDSWQERLSQRDKVSKGVGGVSRRRCASPLYSGEAPERSILSSEVFREERRTSAQ